MSKLKSSKCDHHPNQKQDKFCKNNGCWTRLCSKCASESHKGHRIVDYVTLTQEALSVKENLLQVKKGDLMSLKRIMNNVASLQSQLKEVQEKRNEDRKLSETHIITKIESIAKEGDTKFKELEKMIEKLHKQLKDSHNSQAQELTKIPELADAVITEGTIEDLKTFFEMCQQGIESNMEIRDYKKTADSLRENVENFAMQNPFQFVFNTEKSLFDELKGNNTSLHTTELMDLTVDDKNRKSLVTSCEQKNSLVKSNGYQDVKRNSSKRVRNINQTGSIKDFLSSTRTNSKNNRQNNVSLKQTKLNYSKCSDCSRSRTMSTNSNPNVNNLLEKGKPRKSIAAVSQNRASSSNRDKLAISKQNQFNSWNSKNNGKSLKDVKKTVVEFRKNLKNIVEVMKKSFKSMSSIFLYVW